MTTINLDPTAQTPDNNKVISVDITPENFSDEVLESSQKQLVIAAFWSPKSAASTQLLPYLETAVTATDGIAKLTKIDVSKHQMIAQQMQVKSIPAVYAFWRGQPVDGFMGAIPEQQLSTWLTKLIQTTGAKGLQDPKKGIERAIKQAESLLESGDIITAQAIYEDLAAEFPEEPDVLAGCMNCMIKMDKADEAQALFDTLPKELANDKKMISIKAALELAKEITNDVSPKETEDALKANPDNHQMRYDYAMHLYTRDDSMLAIDQLLEIIKRDRKWNDDGARTQLLKIFEALGPMHEQTIQGRKKLSTILFS